MSAFIISPVLKGDIGVLTVVATTLLREKLTLLLLVRSAFLTRFGD
jgi:hypothetical protein